MAMNVKEANASAKFQGAIQRELWTLSHSLFEMDTILAHDVIHDQGNRDVLHIIGECLGKAVVHINLPVKLNRSDPHLKC